MKRLEVIGTQAALTMDDVGMFVVRLEGGRDTVGLRVSEGETPEIMRFYDGDPAYSALLTSDAEVPNLPVVSFEGVEEVPTSEQIDAARPRSRSY